MSASWTVSPAFGSSPIRYPRWFRTRFEQEWMDLVAWHRARLAGARARSRMFTLCAVASLAVGVGANTAISPWSTRC